MRFGLWRIDMSLGINGGRRIVFVAVLIFFQSSVFSQTSEQISKAKSFVETGEARLQSQRLSQKVHDLSFMTIAAYVSGDSEKAAKFALDIKKDVEDLTFASASTANRAIHTSNTILGLIALDGDKVSEAGAFLIASGSLKGSSPSLKVSGPNMLLAKRLLERGEKDTVIKYLDLCGSLWERDNGSLQMWKAQIKNGEIPDFGAQLRRHYDEWQYIN